MTKYQTKEIIIPAGATANALDFDVELDKAFRHCTGVLIAEKTDGGIGSYDVGISDDNTTYHHLTDKSDWIPSPGVSLNERYKNLYIPNEGQSIKVRVKPDVAVVSELKIQAVFRLEKNG